MPQAGAIGLAVSVTGRLGRRPGGVYGIEKSEVPGGATRKRVIPTHCYLVWRSDQTDSASASKNVTKHKAKTEWLRLAPKYCQRGVEGPG